jgi:hypothetical protein
MLAGTAVLGQAGLPHWAIEPDIANELLGHTRLRAARSGVFSYQVVCVGGLYWRAPVSLTTEDASVNRRSDAVLIESA